MPGLTWRALPMLPQSSVKSSCKVRDSGRWLGLMSIDCKSHFHVTVMKKILVNPLFRGWGEWEKCKIKIQTSLTFRSTLKPVFPIDQTTPQFSVNVHLGQVHSHWTSLELTHSPLQRHACVSRERDWRKYVAHNKADRLISGGRMLWKVIGVTTVDGPDLLTQSPWRLRQCSKSWSQKVLFFNMQSKWEGILTGRQPETIRTLTTKYLQNCAAVKWNCSVQIGWTSTSLGKGPHLTQEHFLKGNFSNRDKSPVLLNRFFGKSCLSVHLNNLENLGILSLKDNSAI